MVIQWRRASTNTSQNNFARPASMTKGLLLGMVMLCGFMLLGWRPDMALAAPLAEMERVFKTVDGQTLRLADLRGKVVLVNFWATWCPPCLEEIPAFVHFYKQYADKGVMVVGVNYMDQSTPEELARFIAKHQINYPILYGDGINLDGLAKALGGVFGLPATKLLDQTGRVVASRTGGLTEQEMQNWVAPLLTTKAAGQ